MRGSDSHIPKKDGSWRMTLDSRKLYQVVTLIVAAVADLVALLG